MFYIFCYTLSTFTQFVRIIQRYIFGGNLNVMCFKIHPVYCSHIRKQLISSVCNLGMIYHWFQSNLVGPFIFANISNYVLFILRLFFSLSYTHLLSSFLTALGNIYSRMFKSSSGERQDGRRGR